MSLIQFARVSVRVPSDCYVVMNSVVEEDSHVINSTLSIDYLTSVLLKVPSRYCKFYVRTWRTVFTKVYLY